jgi:hypothetical protein
VKTGGNCLIRRQVFTAANFSLGNASMLLMPGGKLLATGCLSKSKLSAWKMHDCPRSAFRRRDREVVERVKRHFIIDFIGHRDTEARRLGHVDVVGPK